MSRVEPRRLFLPPTGLHPSDHAVNPQAPQENQAQAIPQMTPAIQQQQPPAVGSVAVPAPAPSMAIVPAFQAAPLQQQDLSQLQSMLQAALNQSGGGGTQGPCANFLVPSSLTGIGGFSSHSPQSSSLPFGTDHTSPSRSGHSAKLPQPQALSNVQRFRQDPEGLQLTIEGFFEYILRAGPPLRWPHDIKLFISDVEVRKWVHSYLEAASAAICASGGSFDQNQFISALVAFVTGEVRPRSVIALEQLMNHEITQGSDSAAKYAEQFYQRSRLLPHISPVVLCHHFVAGLTPELRRLCCVDRSGNDWTSLQPLVQFTLVEERRLNLVSPSRKRVSFQDNDGYAARVAKKARCAAISAPTPMDTDIPPASADVEDKPSFAAVVQKKAPDGNRRPRPSGNGDGASTSSGAGRPALLTPPSACPCFKLNNKGRPLQKWEQECLTAYGLCWFCKSSTEHSAKNCPLKKSSDK